MTLGWTGSVGVTCIRNVRPAEMVVQKTLKDFSMWTSASGVPHLGRSPNSCMKLFWVIVLLACLAAFVYQMYFLVENYLSFHVIVNTALEFRTLPFPVVTVCHLNPYKKSAVMENPELAKLMRGYAAAVNKSLDPTEDIWGFNNLNDTMAMQARAKYHLMYYVAAMTEEEKLRLTYTKDEMIQGCTLNSIECDNDTFNAIIDPIYGQCFSFNHLQEYTTSRAGPFHGLRLFLITDLAEYLYTTESAGMRLTVTSNGEQIFPDAFGYNAAAGFTTSFGLEYIQTQRLGPPYNNCTLKSSKEYSVEACFQQCQQAMIVEMCNCCDPQYNCTPDTTYCENDMLACVLNTTDSVGRGVWNDTNSTNSCDCPDLCNDNSYTLTVSFGNWPSLAYKPPYCEERYQNGTTGGLNSRHWCTKNTMMIEVYFERMNYQSLTQTPAYGLVSLLADFGGQIGLWIGVSAITAIEFVIFPFILVMACCCKKAKPNYRSEDYDEEDNEFDKIGGSVDQRSQPVYIASGKYQRNHFNRNSVQPSPDQHFTRSRNTSVGPHDPYTGMNPQFDLPPTLSR